MRRSIVQILGVILLLTASGCSRSISLQRDHNAVIVDGLVRVWSTRLRLSHRSFHATLHIANESHHDILIRRRDIFCAAGRRLGRPRISHPPRASYLVLPSQGVGRIVLTCQVAHPADAPDLRVFFAHIFEARRDHHRGAVMATDLEWFIEAEQYR